VKIIAEHSATRDDTIMLKVKRSNKLIEIAITRPQFCSGLVHM